ncbi:MAG: 30S ribosomal protein S12 methylthiotransferase RimO, partial [Candidatus Omnitrophota bacterium]|nr:30S ribosomal protein S12 methylthiotransferase RimO [Candidatus Omnitrophota bacterium]
DALSQPLPDTRTNSSRRPIAEEPSATVSMISLGCPRTLVDSELYLGRLAQHGFRVVEDVDGSSAVVINTCSFIQESVKESIDTILQAVELKKQGKVKAVVVAGCLVQRFKQELIKELPEVDGFFGVDGFGEIESVVQRALQGAHPTSLRQRPQVPHQGGTVARSPLTDSHYAYLKISEGCLKGCSFCIIPKIKGPLSSRPLEAVVEEATQLVQERGIKELIVVGQDTSDYGVDLYGQPRIAELLGRLSKVGGLRWIRLLYYHPRGITRDLIETIRDEPVICKYLDMAIEHADDAVLEKMNRGITQARLRQIVHTLRDEIPGIALRTSVITGFPGETEQAFENLLGFLQEIQFERLGAFRYSREEGSASYRFADQVPADVTEARYDRLMRVQQEISAQVNARWLGTTCDVLIDEADVSDPTVFLGRTKADCPEVDGIVFVHSQHPLAPGTFVPVKITDTYEYDLVGTVVDTCLPVSQLAGLRVNRPTG